MKAVHAPLNKRIVLKRSNCGSKDTGDTRLVEHLDLLQITLRQLCKSDIRTHSNNSTGKRKKLKITLVGIEGQDPLNSALWRDSRFEKRAMTCLTYSG